MQPQITVVKYYLKRTAHRPLFNERPHELYARQQNSKLRYSENLIHPSLASDNHLVEVHYLIFPIICQFNQTRDQQRTHNNVVRHQTTLKIIEIQIALVLALGLEYIAYFE